MNCTIKKIDCSEILDWPSFHDVFISAFGFPDFYGRNLSAWVDCMTSLEDDFSGFVVEKGKMVVLQLDHGQKLKDRSPEIWNAILELAAFVNYRRLECDQPPILIVSFYL